MLVLMMFHLFVAVPRAPIRKGLAAVITTHGLLQLEVDALKVGVDRRLPDGFVVAGGAAESLQASVSKKRNEVTD